MISGTLSLEVQILLNSPALQRKQLFSTIFHWLEWFSENMPKRFLYLLSFFSVFLVWSATMKLSDKMLLCASYRSIKKDNRLREWVLGT